MKAVIYNGVRDIQVKDIATPAFGPEQVLIDVAACGICGSDLHLYREDWRPELCTFPYPGGRVPGHEFAGTIAAVGAKVSDYQVGDRVVGLCFGGMAEQVAVNAAPYAAPGAICPVPDGVSLVEAATTEPLSNSLRIVRKSNTVDGENVVVFGMGIIGLGVIQAYRALGIKPANLIAVETSGYRLEAAKRAGADHVLNPTECDVHEEVARICGTQPSFADGDVPAVDVVIDCVGYIKGFPGKPVIQQALDMICDRTGRIVCFGAFEADLQLNLTPLMSRQPLIIGVAGMEAEDVIDGLDFMASGVIDRASLVTHRFPIEEAAEAFEAQDNYADSLKVVILPGGG